MNVALPLVLLSVLLNSAAQILLKEAMNRIGIFAISWANLVPVGWRIIINPFFIAGMLCYVLSLSSWVVVLSRLDVSVAFPLSSMSFIVCALAAYFILGENVTLVRFAGIIVIMIGVFLVTRS